MKRLICMTALALILAHLAACGVKEITAGEAEALALEKVRRDTSHQFSEIFEDRITCEYEQRDGTGYYMVKIPFECSCHAYYVRSFYVQVHAETGRIERLMMSK